MKIASLILLLGCQSKSDPVESVEPCSEAGRLAECTPRTMSDAHYIKLSEMYFDTMDTEADRDQAPDYGTTVARWEWPPWLKLTGFGRDNIEKADTLLRMYPSTIPQRDCRAFDQNPFGRCRVVFYYEDHEGRGCPIYEEFTFNEAGAITFIEAWSDQPDMLPMDEETDPWAEESGTTRLSSRIPGLGTPSGAIDLDSDAMASAEASDEDVADFAYRARDWATTWFAEVDAAGDDMWEVGCGW
jgi:hypothetical protein